MNLYTINEHERFVHLDLWKKRILWLTIVVLTVLTKTQLSAQAPPQIDPCERTFLNFDGADDHLDLSSSTINGTAGTWEAWVRKDNWALQNDGVLFGNSIEFTSSNSMYLSFHSAVGLHFRYGGTGEGGPAIFGQFTNSFAANSWHHIAVTWEHISSTTTLRMYVDGIEQISTTTPLFINSGSRLTFGADDGNGHILEAGSLADIRTWNIARSQAQIAADMNVRLNGDETGLTGYWPLDDALGSATATNLVFGASVATLTSFDLATAWVIDSQAKLRVAIPGGAQLSNGETIDFGTQRTETTSSSMTIEITNVSNSAVQLTGMPIVSLSGANANQFNTTQLSAATLASMATDQFEISFSPDTDGTKNALLSIASDDLCTNPFEINLQGFATTNLPPVFVSSASESVGENATGIVLDVDANDGGGGANDQGMTYSISAGTDQV